MPDKAEQNLEQVLAASLTAEDTGLLPYLPYLLQDLWELGGDGDAVAGLLRGRLGQGAKVLDLACGKGAVSIKLAKALVVSVKGVDFLPEFVEEARQKAAEHGVEALCSFEAGDANAAADAERGYDGVVFSAAGNVLGEPPRMLEKLAATVKPGGYVALGESYLPDEGGAEILYNNYEMHTRAQWEAMFSKAGLGVVAEAPSADDMPEKNASDMAHIARRAAELAGRYPDRRAMFEGYVQSQLNEVQDVENTFINVDWLLQKR